MEWLNINSEIIITSKKGFLFDQMTQIKSKYSSRFESKNFLSGYLILNA